MKMAPYGFAALLALSHTAGATAVGNGTPASCTEQALKDALRGGGQVSFNCGAQPHAIQLSSPAWIDKDTVLDGGGLITLDGRGKNGVLELEGDHEPDLVVAVKNIALINGASQRLGSGLNAKSRVTLDVQNVIFSHNRTTTPDGNCTRGGALFVGYASTVRVANSLFSHNQAADGGAIAVIHTDLKVHNSRFEYNVSERESGMYSCGGGGGAIYIDGARPPGEGGDNAVDSLLFEGSRFIGNTTNYHGGAIFINVYDNDSAVINTNLFEANSATGNQGGGAVWYSRQRSTKKLSVLNSLFLNNQSDVYGGALYADAPTLITNSTFYGNAVLDEQDGMGGALMASAGTELHNCTLVFNRAGLTGGAILSGSSSKPTLINTLVAYNTSASGMGMNCSHNLIDGGGNLHYPGGKESSCISGLTVREPALGLLQDNGGFTRSIAPQLGSPALDAGTDSCPATDQRGLSRPRDGNGDGVARCDIGAVEMDSSGGIARKYNGSAYELSSGQFYPTTTQFVPLLTAANGQSGNALHLPVNVALDIDMHLVMEAGHVGQAASFIMLAQYTYLGQTYWLSRAGPNWRLWDGNPYSLQVADTRPSLAAAETLNIIRGLQGLPGQFEVWVGYLLNSGLIVYNQGEPIIFHIE